MTPISKDIIQAMIKRHLDSYYKIGDLYDVGVRKNCGDPLETCTVPLLTYEIDFEYDKYAIICNHGKSIPMFGRGPLIPGTYDSIQPYNISMKYSYLLENKITPVQWRVPKRDPISSNQTMNGVITEFAKSCIKIIKRHGD